MLRNFLWLIWRLVQEGQYVFVKFVKSYKTTLWRNKKGISMALTYLHRSEHKTIFWISWKVCVRCHEAQFVLNFCYICPESFNPDVFLFYTEKINKCLPGLVDEFELPVHVLDYVGYPIIGHVRFFLLRVKTNYIKTWFHIAHQCAVNTILFVLC